MIIPLSILHDGALTLVRGISPTILGPRLAEGLGGVNALHPGPNCRLVEVFLQIIKRR